MSEFLLKNPIRLSPSSYVEGYLRRHLFENVRYRSTKRLNRFEFQVFSKNGEDGIIEEIFNRIGVENMFFVELGVQKDTECNTTYLLFKEWKGLWVVEEEDHIPAIKGSCQKILEEERLMLVPSLMNRENIEDLFHQAAIIAEPDLLSINSVDNGYHLWSAIGSYRPRVVIVQYNAIFRPGTNYVMPYRGKAIGNEYSNFGASLQAFYEWGATVGYSVVGCDFTGTHAFFVRNDLLLNLFEFPYTPANHYEPARPFLFKKEGHTRKLLL
jgi:hypothetical protein